MNSHIQGQSPAEKPRSEEWWSASSLEADTRAYANKQFRKARHLLSLGMIVDPQHGPLYHGNMELRHGNTRARDVFMLGIPPAIAVT